uniref:Major facilitator superfamily (MFS) profile domain-containing protein n=1 Tax=Timema tahoe TaxID=61484 RepID=A0A7R9IE35_9NEOP|nr:unnamed protein product [Timema tahoe]
MGDLTGKGGAIDPKLFPFEDAIALTGHGKFHHLLLVGCGLCFATFLFQSLNSAYLLPAAACDFQMTVQDKGLLSSMFYVGMICSSHMWGYLADTYGRKKVLVCGMLMDSICSFFGSFSHALWLYLIVRFFNGALICPNSNVLFAYLGEFHSSSTRTRAIIFLNISIMLGATILPGLAWLIIPQTWAWELPWITYRSWRLFVIVTALPGLITVLYMARVLPESPKYLLVTGRSQEALEILRRIYADNSGEPPESYPVLSVTIDGSVAVLPSPLGSGKKNSALDVMKSIWRQTAPLFVPPHLRNTTIACLFMFFVYACSNSLSLWIPDMFNNLGVYYNLNPEGPSRLCEAIGSSSANMTAPVLPSSLEVIYSDLLEEPACVIQITSQTFINPMIFGVIAGAVFIPMGFVINKLGKKNTMYMCVLVATSGAIGLYFVVTPIWAITLASMYYSFIFATVGALNSIVIDIFPTHLRAMAVSLTLMVGRIGTICGSILLATLLELSCDSIFFVYAGTALGGDSINLVTYMGRYNNHPSWIGRACDEPPIPTPVALTAILKKFKMQNTVCPFKAEYKQVFVQWCSVKRILLRIV